MGERFNPAVLKTAGSRGPVGSNPTPSAIFFSVRSAHARAQARASLASQLQHLAGAGATWSSDEQSGTRKIKRPPLGAWRASISRERGLLSLSATGFLLAVHEEPRVSADSGASDALARPTVKPGGLLRWGSDTASAWKG